MSHFGPDPPPMEHPPPRRVCGPGACFPGPHTRTVPESEMSTLRRHRRLGLGLLAIALYLGCAKGASTFDGAAAGHSGGGSSTCGNGAIDASEECDGTNLHDESCKSLGMGSGMLTCDPITCSYDTSMCTSRSGGMGGAGS